MIPCDQCKPMAVWGTLMIPATHFVVLRGKLGVGEATYLCGPHAYQAWDAGEVVRWEQLDARGLDIPPLPTHQSER